MIGFCLVSHSLCGKPIGGAGNYGLLAVQDQAKSVIIIGHVYENTPDI
jgi:hypothetical protein